MINKLDSQKIAQLDPTFAGMVRELIEVSARHNAFVGIVQGYRSQHEQDVLYASGRTVPGPIKTKLQVSPHSSGLAVDVAARKGASLYYPPIGWYKFVHKIGDLIGFSAFIAWDPGHFEVVRKKAADVVFNPYTPNFVVGIRVGESNWTPGLTAMTTPGPFIAPARTLGG